MNSSILQKDYDNLKSILGVEINRYSRNPTTYDSNLIRRALDIVTEHISEDALPVTSEKRFSSF